MDDTNDWHPFEGENDGLNWYPFHGEETATARVRGFRPSYQARAAAGPKTPSRDDLAVAERDNRKPLGRI